MLPIDMNLKNEFLSVHTGWLSRSGILFDFSLTVKAAPHECVIRTGQ